MPDHFLFAALYIILLSQYDTDFMLEAKAGGDTATANLNVLYCDKSTGLFDSTYWLKENFLTLSPFRRLAPDSYINISWYTTEKVKADRSIATLGKSSQFYDVTTSKEYEVESAVLTTDECLQVEQMLTSPSVRIPYGHDAAIYDNDFDAIILFPYGNPTALYWNCVTSFLSVTRSMAAGGMSRYFPPASAARYATAVSSASTTAKYPFDIPLKMRNFANK